VDFEDGSAQGKFSVAAAIDPSNPQTGDSIGLWAGLMAVSFAGIGALIFFGRKKILK
jgi:LPXTG-motif cell wall-anchored protein